LVGCWLSHADNLEEEKTKLMIENNLELIVNLRPLTTISKSDKDIRRRFIYGVTLNNGKYVPFQYYTFLIEEHKDYELYKKMLKKERLWSEA